MRRAGVAFVTLWGLAACGRDPILEKAEADAAARAAETRRGRAEMGVGDPSGATAGAPPDGALPSAGNGPGGTGGIPGAAQPGDPSGGPVALGPDGQPLPGKAEPPPPGDPSKPPPGGSVGDPSKPPPGGTVGVPTAPSAPGGGAPGGAPGQPGAPQGPTVALSGTVAFPAHTRGSVKISAFNGDHAVTTGKRPEIIGFAQIDRPGPFTLAVPENAGKVYLEAAVDEDGDGRPGPLDPQGHAERYPVTVATRPVTGLTIVLTRREPPPGGRGTDF